MKHFIRRARVGGAKANANRLVRWVVRPLALAVLTLSLGLGGGTAWAYFTDRASGTGHTNAGSPVSITVTAASGTADLLPGGKGAVYFTLTNTNAFGETFNQVTGASVVVNNATACPSSNLSIVPTAFPSAFSPAVTVGAKATSTTQSILNVVALAKTAPSTCQGMIFTVTLTLAGTST